MLSSLARTSLIRWLPVVLVAAVLTTAGQRTGAAASPAVLSIDFVGRATSMGASEVAGVVPRARWNTATGANRSSAMSLVDEGGTASGAKVTWASDVTGATGIVDQTGNNRAMKGFIEGQGTRSARVTVSGLVQGTYDVYVYLDGSNGSATRSATYRISGTGVTSASVVATDAASTNFAGTFTEANSSAGNYVRFRITSSGFTVTATPSASSSGTPRAPINGLQIVPVQATPVVSTFAIRGTVNAASGGAGTTLSLTGVVSASTTADAQGAYSFTNLPKGNYVVTPTKAGFTFAPEATAVTIGTADVGGVNFAPLGPTKARANGYDDAWEAAWVSHGRALLAGTSKTTGFVLHIGDSITFSRAYSAWARYGEGRTAEDVDIANWMRSGSWSATTNDTSSKSGWYLAGADTTSRRSMTAAGGLSTTELVLGCCNSGPTMPAPLDATQARQLLADPTYTGNLQALAIASAFSDAQFAVVMLGTNDPSGATSLSDLALTVDALEAARILPILSTVPPRNDGLSNQFTLDFNAGVRALARQRSLPLIDYYQEILLRRPGTSWVDTLIGTDGVHPTGDRAGFTVASNPYAVGGDPSTHTTGDATANVGYLLRSWLTLQKLKEVKRFVVDGINP